MTAKYIMKHKYNTDNKMFAEKREGAGGGGGGGPSDNKNLYVRR